MQVSSFADGIATVQVTVDDLRTAPDALTAAEQANDATEPVAFPPALDEESLIVDSTLTIPVFDQDRPLDFIDDFSTATTQFSFWDGRDRGEFLDRRLQHMCLIIPVNHLSRLLMDRDSAGQCRTPADT